MLPAVMGSELPHSVLQPGLAMSVLRALLLCSIMTIR